MVGQRSFLLGLALFGIFVDIFVPPAVLPEVSNGNLDTIGSNILLSWIWSLSTHEQVLLSFLATAVLLGVMTFVSSIASPGGTISHARDFEWKQVMPNGATIALMGWALRCWAKVSLSEQFTYIVTTPPSLLSSGPYTLLIHPGYAGSLLHMCGIFILAARPFGKYIGSCLVILSVSMAFAALSLRIREEEAALSAQFGAEWSAHTATRWRLVPFVW